MNYRTQKNLITIVLCTFSVFSAPALAVVVPAGSVDALATAIAEAGPGGEVVLAAGPHQISDTVMVEIPVSIVGENGAVLESANSGPDDVVNAALHIRGADGARIENVIIQTPADANVAAANAGIVIESASDVQIVNNQITGHTNGILIEHGDRALLKGNAVQTTKDGIVLINGSEVSIQDNFASCTRFGIWIGSERADITGNTLQGNMIGLLLCSPRNFIISGELRSTDTPATDCMVYQNYAFDNAWGYLVFDGAFDNLLMNNAAAFNSSYDIELGGESMRFGILTPTTSGNTVMQGLKYAGLKVKVCGINNQALGNVDLVDNATDPCF
jgi:parallel beta-helix repeat protein